MSQTTMQWRRVPSLLGLLGCAVLMASCANPAINDAKSMARSGQHEMALQRLQREADIHQDDQALRGALLQQRDVTVSYLIDLAGAARASGNVADMESVQQRLQAADAQNPRVAWLKSETDRLKRHQRLLNEAQESINAQRLEKGESALRVVLTEDPSNAQARSQLAHIEELRERQTRRDTHLQLAMASKAVTLEFRDASLKTVFETLARAADVNFVFDKDVRGDAKVTLFLRNTTVEEALRVILNTQQLNHKLLNDNTVLVFPATQQKQRDLLDTVTRTFYLVNADPKQAQALVRTVAKSRDVFVDDRLNLLVVRDTPEVMRLVERLIQSIDLADPEVMMEIEVMEVTNNQMDSLGINWPASASYGVPGSTAPLTTYKGLQAFTTNPLALATLKATRDAANILANPKIRARNREKAHVLLGEKLPVFTTTSTPINGSVSNAVAISYIDVGLKLDVEPQVQLDNDVTIKVALEVSSITSKVSDPTGTSSAYQVGTRQATTTLRLKDGETQILAGLINDSETRNSAGVPGLHDLPVVGRLFGLTTNEHKKTEIVLLVTPHIIRSVMQPAVAASPMPSGTETQPGAQPLKLRDDASSFGSGSGARGSTRSDNSARGASRDAPQMISGPQEVLPGASFQVVLHSRTSEPFATEVVFDTSLLESDEAGARGGRIPITVGPRGAQAVTLRAKAGITTADTLITFEGQSEGLNLRIRAANAPPDAPNPEPDHGSHESSDH